MLFPYHKSKVAIKLAKSWEFELEAFISMHEEGFSCVSHHLIMALKVALIRSTDGNIFAVVGERNSLHSLPRSRREFTGSPSKLEQL